MSTETKKKPSKKTRGDKQPRPVVGNVESMMSRADVADALRVSVRHLDGMIGANEYPQPDTYLGRAPRWDRETHNLWVRKRCKKEV